jgi:hypothetical protein
MSRPKGVKNKVTVELPDACNLSPIERIELLANLMIDRILLDQSGNQELLKAIDKTVGEQNHAALS